MLPFLKPRQTTTITIAKQKPDGSIEDNDESNEGLNVAAEDLIKAVHAKDAVAVAAALKSAWEICESYEDEEPSEVVE